MRKYRSAFQEAVRCTETIEGIKQSDVRTFSQHLNIRLPNRNIFFEDTTPEAVQLLLCGTETIIASQIFQSLEEQQQKQININ